jgi:hypothetical protein
MIINGMQKSAFYEESLTRSLLMQVQMPGTTLKHSIPHLLFKQLEVLGVALFLQVLLGDES